MNARRLLKCAVLVLLMVGCFPALALGYVGPGTGMSAVGVFLAVVMGIVVALFGFLWYPFKRMVRTFRKRIAVDEDEEQA
jgi:hypothetical protein